MRIETQEQAIFAGRFGLRGFVIIFRSEFKRWWHTRRWLLQSGLWLLLMNGMLALIAIVSRATGEFDLGASDVRQVFGMLGLLGSLGAVIVMQNVYIGERESGITEWILSKPVSRINYLLGKLMGNAAGFIPVVWLFTAPGVYLILSQLFLGEWLSVGSFLLGWSLVGLEIAFYLCLTMLLGVYFNNRGAVLAIPLALLFGQQILIGLMKGLIYVLPYSLSAVNAGSAALGEALPYPFPILAAAVWCLVMIALAGARFRRYEF